MDKIAKITAELDLVADQIEKSDPSLALAIDRISDRLEKQAYFNPALWLPGRSSRSCPSNGYPQKRSDDRQMAVCSYCNAPVPLSKGAISCPRCGRSLRY